MEYQFRNKVELTEFTSVWLRESRIADNLQIFFCPICRDSILQYRGEIVTLLPGTSESHLPIVVQCKSCHHKYMFHQIVKKEVV